MCKQRMVTNRPDWKDPAATLPGKGSPASPSPNGSDKGRFTKSPVQSLMFSKNWTLIKAGDDFYVEFHGSDCPWQLETRKDGISLVT